MSSPVTGQRNNGARTHTLPPSRQNFAAARKAAAHAAALDVVLPTTLAAAAAAPEGYNFPRYGAKRSADLAGIETQRDAAAQSDAPARAAAAQEETRSPKGPVPGQVELTRPVKWTSMSRSTNKNWKTFSVHSRGNYQHLRYHTRTSPLSGIFRV
jgi:hypothetical protein